MKDATDLLSRIKAGDLHASADLLPLVYEELRELASAKMARERADHTLQATALVHEAYVRLVKGSHQGWNSRNHFFAAAAEAMRRILVESARKKNRREALGQREEVQEFTWLDNNSLDKAEVLAIDEALGQLEEKSPRKAKLVKLRYFLGCSMPESAEILGIGQSTAEADWTFAKAWIRRHLGDSSGD